MDIWEDKTGHQVWFRALQNMFPATFLPVSEKEAIVVLSLALCLWEHPHL